MCIMQVDIDRIGITVIMQNGHELQCDAIEIDMGNLFDRTKLLVLIAYRKKINKTRTVPLKEVKMIVPSYEEKEAKNE